MTGMFVGPPAPGTLILGTEHRVAEDGFDGGWRRFRNICDDCWARCCPGHIDRINQAFADRAAAATSVVTAAEEITTGAAETTTVGAATSDGALVATTSDDDALVTV